MSCPIHHTAPTKSPIRKYLYPPSLPQLITLSSSQICVANINFPPLPPPPPMQLINECHVDLVNGCRESYQKGTSLDRQGYEPSHKVTLMINVPWNYHPYIIGKEGNIVKKITSASGLGIHFPDRNKNATTKKSNQVALHCQREDLHGLEEARKMIRLLTPLTYTFNAPSWSKIYLSDDDARKIMKHVKNNYKLNVHLLRVGKQILAVSVSGIESEAEKIKNATEYLIHLFYCNSEDQVPIEVSTEVSSQDHSFVFGSNLENVTRIMDCTTTKIIISDGNDSEISHLDNSRVTIYGSLDNVYTALQLIIGSLPMVLSFDLVPKSESIESDLMDLMNILDVEIYFNSSCKKDGMRNIRIKGPERNVENIYMAWRFICNVCVGVSKAKTPSALNLQDAFGSIQRNDVSCGNHKSGFTCTSQLVRDASPDQILTSSLTFADSSEHHISQSINDFSRLLKNVDRRAPGCEKILKERVVGHKISLSDLMSKIVLKERLK